MSILRGRRVRSSNDIYIYIYIYIHTYTDICEFGDRPWMYSNLPALTGSTIGFGSRPQEGKKPGVAAGDSPKSRSVQRGRGGHRFLRGGPQFGFWATFVGNPHW